MNKKSVYLVLGIFAVLFAVQFVSAAPLAEALDNIPVISDAVTFLGGIDNLPVILLSFLLVLLVYSVAGTIPFVSDAEDWIKWALSIGVAILSFITVDSSTIEAIMVNYEVLGVALTSILPLIILISFTSKLEKDHPEYSIVSNILTGFFIVYWMYKMYQAAAPASNGSWEWSTAALMYLVAIAAGIVWVIGKAKIINYARKKIFIAGMSKANSLRRIELEGKLNELYNERDAIAKTAKKGDIRLQRLDEAIEAVGSAAEEI